jgi:hypothetical protein
MPLAVSSATFFCCLGVTTALGACSHWNTFPSGTYSCGHTRTHDTA